LKTSSFLLCVLSEGWERQLHGCFQERSTKRIVLDDVEQDAFPTLILLACCVPRPIPPSFPELVTLALLADRFAIDPLRAALEWEAAHRLTLADCPTILNLSAAIATGLDALPRAARNLACDRFESLAVSPGLLSLTDDALFELLDDHHLGAPAEERVLEAAARWLRDDPARLRGPADPARLLAAVRIRPGYLEQVALRLLPEVPLLELLVSEALALQAARSSYGEQQLQAARSSGEQQLQAARSSGEQQPQPLAGEPAEPAGEPAGPGNPATSARTLLGQRTLVPRLPPRCSTIRMWV
jgi:hypothetical protein